MHDEFTHWKQPSLERILALGPEVVICQVEEAQSRPAKHYWQELFNGRARVYIVMEDNWTIPAGHLVDYTERMAEFIGENTP